MLKGINIKKVCSRAPVFGGVFEANKKSQRGAFIELFISTLFSTLPIWFFPLLASGFITSSPGFTENVYSSVSQGDLFIYSSALVGPLIFAITKNYATWGEKNSSANSSRIGKLTFEFPSGMWFFVSSLGICAIAAFSFGILRLSNMGLLSVQINSENMLWTSGALYFYSLICLYAVSVYKNELENYSVLNNVDTQVFIKDWNQRRDDRNPQND